MDSPDSLDFEQSFFASVLRQELDGQGRVTFPEELLRMCDLGREVVLAGAKVRIDIWRKADYQAFCETDKSQRWETFRKFMRMPAQSTERPSTS
jgi:DNA-binding transcriptional regulator/RsmH inhibitor MraZ